MIRRFAIIVEEIPSTSSGTSCQGGRVLYSLKEATNADAPEFEEAVTANRLVVHDAFFSEASELRSAFGAPFLDARSSSGARFVWDNWYIDGQYSYHRTPAREFFRTELYDSFIRRLSSWGLAELGCGRVTAPWLSYYVDGNSQELHADVPHGPWSYVLSLTSWEDRRFTGGETLLAQEGLLDFWSRGAWDKGLELSDLFEVIEPAFGRLTVFDAKLPHAVRRVEGTRDPLHSRVALHGWFSAPALRISEAVNDERLVQQIARAVTSMVESCRGATNGFVIIGIDFSDDGIVSNIDILTDTRPTGRIDLEQQLDSAFGQVEASGAGRAIVPVIGPREDTR